jgi:carnitine O-acetyltransferase
MSSTSNSQKVLYAHQDSLPNLPVPTLEETCSLYLKSLEPLLTPQELSHSRKAVLDFLASPQSKELQNRLLERKKEMDAKGRSWLIDWWNDYAYMAYRDPLVIFVSYFFGEF